MIVRFLIDDFRDSPHINIKCLGALVHRLIDLVRFVRACCFDFLDKPVFLPQFIYFLIVFGLGSTIGVIRRCAERDVIDFIIPSVVVDVVEDEPFWNLCYVVRLEVCCKLHCHHSVLGFTLSFQIDQKITRIVENPLVHWLILRFKKPILDVDLSLEDSAITEDHFVVFLKLRFEFRASGRTSQICFDLKE